MIFAWDENKNRINRRKHGVSFETAARVFEDPNVVSYRDRVVDEEERWHAVGCAGGIALLLVVHTSEEPQQLEDRPDSQIDYSDAPEGSPRASDIEVGRFYRPIKQLVSLRVDADVLAWFRGQGKKYQTRINDVLRREMQTNARDG